MSVGQPDHSATLISLQRCLWSDPGAVVLSLGDLDPPGVIRQCLKTVWVVTTREEMLLASSGWRSGMLPDILQCTGQSPQLRIIQPKCQWVEKACLREIVQVWERNLEKGRSVREGGWGVDLHLERSGEEEPEERIT